jgi:prepilin-type processing-associated H-X9-DG protein
VKPRISNKRNQALTRVEVLVVIVVLVIAALFLFPVIYVGPQGPAHRSNCINNLKEQGTAFRIWAQDNGDKYPMQTSVTNGGTMELVANGRNAWMNFFVMSNSLTDPKLLICPQDTRSILATSYGRGFNNSNFVGLDATDSYPQMFLSGDDNFAIGGVPVKSGLLEFQTNAPVTWSSGRHVSYNSHFWTPARYRFIGNIGFADGSVQQLTTDDLQKALQQTGVATNRLAIP